jgi:hypothetical protein
LGIATERLSSDLLKYLGELGAADEIDLPGQSKLNCLRTKAKG